MVFIDLVAFVTHGCVKEKFPLGLNCAYQFENIKLITFTKYFYLQTLYIITPSKCAKVTQ